MDIPEASGARGPGARPWEGLHRRGPWVSRDPGDPRRDLVQSDESLQGILRPAEVSPVMGMAWGPRPRTGEGGVQDEPPVSLSDDLASEDRLLEEEPAVGEVIQSDVPTSHQPVGLNGAVLL